MFVYRREALVLAERISHLERSHSVHVAGDDRDSLVALLRVPEHIRPLQLDVRSRLESATLGPQQNVTEIQLQILVYARHAARNYKNQFEE